MGASAAGAALAAADVNAAQIDAIIAVGSVPYKEIPCTAVFIQRELGLGKSGRKLRGATARKSGCNPPMPGARRIASSTPRGTSSDGLGPESLDIVVDCVGGARSMDPST